MEMKSRFLLLFTIVLVFNTALSNDTALYLRFGIEGKIGQKFPKYISRPNDIWEITNFKSNGIRVSTKASLFNVNLGIQYSRFEYSSLRVVNYSNYVGTFPTFADSLFGKMVIHNVELYLGYQTNFKKHLNFEVFGRLGPRAIVGKNHTDARFHKDSFVTGQVSLKPSYSTGFGFNCSYSFSKQFSISVGLFRDQTFRKKLLDNGPYSVLEGVPEENRFFYTGKIYGINLGLIYTMNFGRISKSKV